MCIDEGLSRVRDLQEAALAVAVATSDDTLIAALNDFEFAQNEWFNNLLRDDKNRPIFSEEIYNSLS